ncbi:hypothetical protein ACLKA7_001701 [Drosophila subpalustris]
MNTEIWNSSQMGGTGGALKALAKNLANQLNLNRTEMKRVVARVISERHGQGDVGDYNGHMFYVKPERIDLTEQITHSKEAFDEMLNQNQYKMQRCGSKSQMLSPCSKSRSRSLKYNMAMRHKNINDINNNNINNNINFNKPDKSLVVQNQCQHPPQIAGQMSKSKIKCIKSRQQIKRKPQIVNSQQQPQNPHSQSHSQAKCQPKPSKSVAKPKSISKLPVQGRPKLISNKNNNRKKFIVRLEVKNLNLNLSRKPALSKRSQRPQASGSGTNNNVQRLNAGKGIQQEKLRPMIQIEPESQPQPQPQLQPVVLAQAEESTGKKTILKKKKSLKQLPKAKSNRKTYDQPWLEPKRLTTKRLRAGGILTKPNRIPVNPMFSTSSKTWRHPYQYPGGAGATQRSSVNPCSKSKYSPKIKPRISSNKLPMSKNSGKQKSKQTLERLAKQLERDEAIDDPERLEAGSMMQYKLKRSFSTNSRRVRRPYKLSARLEELAKPVFHGKPSPDKLPVRSRPHSHNCKPKLKLRSRRRRRRVMVDSSLGSIAGLKGTSRSGLTPAKRHLTLAFMNKDTRSPRRSRSVMWR